MCNAPARFRIQSFSAAANRTTRARNLETILGHLEQEEVESNEHAKNYHGHFVGTCYRVSCRRANSGHFDLKGERLGESLESFKQIHLLAQCVKNEPARQTQLGEDRRTIHKDVSFAGLPAVPDADCSARIIQGSVSKFLAPVR
jgi:hypothetical protein